MKIENVLRPLEDKPIQAYIGKGLHTLGLLSWILKQTGKADIVVSSFSTSEPFLNGFVRLNDKGLIGQSILLLDIRAAKKTSKLLPLMNNAFDSVFLGQNHSKIILIAARDLKISVVTSQNQTYGDRAESTIVTTDKEVFAVLEEQLETLLATQSIEVDIKNGKRKTKESGRIGRTAADAPTDWRPFGVEW